MTTSEGYTRVRMTDGHYGAMLLIVTWAVFVGSILALALRGTAIGHRSPTPIKVHGRACIVYRESISCDWTRP